MSDDEQVYNADEGYDEWDCVCGALADRDFCDACGRHLLDEENVT